MSAFVKIDSFGINFKFDDFICSYFLDQKEGIYNPSTRFNTYIELKGRGKPLLVARDKDLKESLEICGKISLELREIEEKRKEKNEKTRKKSEK